LRYRAADLSSGCGAAEVSREPLMLNLQRRLKKLEVGHFDIGAPVDGASGERA
jgi:hypothetical protein